MTTSMVWSIKIYPSELQLNKANSSKTQTPFLDLHLFILDGFITTKLLSQGYQKKKKKKKKKNW